MPIIKRIKKFFYRSNENKIQFFQIFGAIVLPILVLLVLYLIVMGTGTNNNQNINSMPVNQSQNVANT